MIRALFKRSRATAGTMALAAVVFARGAGADTPTNEVAAQALFDDAKASMQRGDYASACPKLEESQRLQPAGGTLLFIGLCLEGAGKTATAWTRFNEALSMARRDARTDRERVAAEHIAALAPKLTRIDVVVPDADKAVASLRVSRDGEDVPAAIWGTPIPVDPGSHEVRVTAPGRKAWKANVVTAGEGATATITVPVLEPDTEAPGPPASAPSLAPVPAPASLPVTPPSPAETGSTGRGQRILALAMGGAGVVGLGIGSYYGVSALSRKNEENAANGCPNGSSGACYSNGVTISREAVNDGTIASIALGVGAAAVVGAAVLWLTAPSGAPSVSVTPTVGRSSAGVGLAGAW
jgi:hypothetical protein